MPLQPKTKSRQYLNIKHHGKTKLIKRKKQRILTPKKTSEEPSLNASLLTGLVNDLDTTLENKREYLKAFHAKWGYKDVKKVVERLELVF